ncbi:MULTISPECIES: TrbI/VirB10 family protein [unclassified Sphingomonas]|jgi:type IV secretory pathway VirB10-like protein|uniref:TrbI/VirB10 family protein n=1 Tax=unclassified Sphingomonas TaxID=196159 RepID=UPI000832501B|nr:MULTISPECIES: TrbI/VirB10 family protein [unclassified Sphingomonas]
MTEAAATAPQAAAPAKVDPETLVLRARPAPAIRFKRGLIVALAAGAIVVLVVTAWLALKPRSLQLVGEQNDLAEPAKAPSDALSALPTSYGNAPQLGPPLPGDLGRPILKHQQAIAADGTPPQATAAEQAAQAARAQAAAERKAARESPVLVQAGNRTAAGEAAPASAAAAAPQSTADATRVALDPDRDPNAQQRKADFVSAQDRNGDINPHAIRPAASPYTLSAGSVIAGSLITGLRSDLPGLVTAQVTERVFDSATGRILLIPQGARLIGTYDSVVAFGQRRALVVWQRIIFPDGRSLRIENVPATDPAGYAGLEDKVDFHTWTLLKGVAISTLLGVGSNLTFSGESDLVQALRESTQQNVARAGDQITSRNLQIQPTITVRPGTPVRLVVHRDLVLAPPVE